MRRSSVGLAVVLALAAPTTVAFVAAGKVAAQTTPTLTTSLNATTIPVGTSDFDTAAFSGFVTGGTGGTVTYTAYSDNNCTSNPLDGGTFDVDPSGSVPNSNPVTFSSAGAFYWQAVYSGDNNNDPTQSVCTDEQLTVTAATPAIGTSLNSDSITVAGMDFDTATLSGFAPGGGTGTVTYTVFSDSSCLVNPQSAGTKTVTAGGGVPNSNTLTFNSAGTFYWQAVYSGDSNNSGATSLCTDEQMVVGSSSTSIGTSLNINTVTVGATDFDTATLSGFVPGGGTGTVTYTVYSNNACSLNPQPAGTKTVTTGGGVPNSNTLTFGLAGTYYWQAVYSGDSNNSGASSLCTDEQMVVVKLANAITTSLNTNAITVGTSDFDTATLSGFATGGGTGTVTYTVYSNSTCSLNPQPAGTKTVTGSGGVPNSNTLTFGTAGTYYWQAVYSGDSNNVGATSVCIDEVLVVGKTSTLTLSTSLNTTTITAGSSDFDRANLSSAFVEGGTGGRVLYSVFSDSSCTNVVQSSGPFDIDEGTGNVPNSDPLTFGSAGTYYWVASFMGDTNNDPVSSACSSEPMTVTKASPTLTTNSNPNNGTAGLNIPSLTDTATFHGTTSTAPTGSVTFTLYTDTTCTTAVAGVTGSGTVGTVSGTSTASFSTSWTPTTASTYSWLAHYPGDANYSAITTGCADANEQIAVGMASPTLSTQANPTTATGGVSTTAGDTATFSSTGAAAPTGSVTFTLYTDTTCSTGAGVTGSGPIATSAGRSTATFSTSWTPSAAGTYSWRAHYAGDTNNNGFTTGCNDANEQVAVGKASPTLATLASPSTAVTGAAITVGDTATFAAAASPSGSVTFTLYSNTACTTSTGVTGSHPITTSAGVSSSTFSTSTPWTPPTPGVYYWIASYPGDSNNNGFTTTCQAANESITVANPVTPTVTAISQTAGPQGGGAIVTITGANLIGTTEVDFGSLHVTATGFHGYPCGPPLSPAGCFGVIGSTLISVFTPQASAAGPVSITVTNPAGSATLTTQYTYVAPGAYTGITPFRICDTRSGCLGHPLGANQAFTLRIAGVVGPAGQSVPVGAQAAVLNVTAVSLGKTPTFVTVYPGPGRPTASNINIDGGATQANLVIAQMTAGATGGVTIYNAVGSVNIIVDVEGYFAPPPGSGPVPGEFHSMAPLRICDTRAKVQTKCAIGAIGPNSWRDVVLSGLPSGVTGVPSVPTTGAAAVVFNLTATQGTAGTYLAVEPPGAGDVCSGKPPASNLNPKPGETLPNRVISKLGPNQDVCVYNAAGSTQIVVDINGWFGDGTEAATTPPAALFYAIPPSRICDTRSNSGTRCAGHPLTANLAEAVQVAGVNAVPARGGSTTPLAVVANLTGVSGTASTVLSLYPSDVTHTTSDLNPSAHDVIANLAIVGLSTTSGKNPGDVNLWNAVGTINAILDVAGWFQ